MKSSVQSALNDDLLRIMEARHYSPHSVLGRHENDGTSRLLCFLPQAEAVSILPGDLAMKRLPGTGFFEWSGPADQLADRYQLRWTDKDGQRHLQHDPYRYPPRISEFDLHLFAEGNHWHIYRVLGAHVEEIDGVTGVRFATWAPNAERVSVVGDFNHWDGRTHPMQSRGASGVWELFIPDLGPGDLYKFEIRNRETGELLLKADPYARRAELRPGTASLVVGEDHYDWQDREWLDQRRQWDWQHQPMSVYEVHLGSWQRRSDGGFLNYRELAEQLVTHVRELGFTHLELLPVTEHPFDDSWGYQTTGYFAPTARHGSPDDFRHFVDYCHQHGIGVIMDWVPAHFPKDSFGLARFDGTPLYEHADPRLGEHRDWQTLIYNYGRNEVRNFLLSSALYWLEEYHIDGLRVDAVASMLYLDYSREADDWVPNKYGGNENLEAIDFFRQLNEVTHGEHPGTLMIAEESTAWPQITRPTWVGGLGFSMKWNMGWMHDTLIYMSKDPVHRHFHHDQLTFGLLYAFTENFVLPFSHDEVVHGKSSMIGKMPGDDWQKFANLRLLYTYMFTYPGKKLLFMGAEIGQWKEWDHHRAVDWPLLDFPHHQGLQRLVGAVNHVYREEPALHGQDFDPAGFDWIDCHDADQSVISYLRRSGDRLAIVVLNFTPVPRYDYRIGVPQPGRYRERLNSDSEYFAGSNVGNWGILETDPEPWMGYPHSLNLTLPPLGGLVLVPEGD